MGYRSEIKICMKKENFEELKSIIIEKISNEDKFAMYKAEEHEKGFLDEYIENNGIVLFGWNSLKWYDYYELPKTVKEYLNKLDRENIPYKYVEIGEDYKTEERENYVNGECDKFTLTFDLEYFI